MFVLERSIVIQNQEIIVCFIGQSVSKSFIYVFSTRDSLKNIMNFKFDRLIYSFALRVHTTSNHIHFFSSFSCFLYFLCHGCLSTEKSTQTCHFIYEYLRDRIWIPVTLLVKEEDRETDEWRMKPNSSRGVNKKLYEIKQHQKTTKLIQVWFSRMSCRFLLCRSQNGSYKLHSIDLSSCLTV